jgi:hypothetical protein
MTKPFYERGRYRCEVTGQGVCESQNSKTPQVLIRFRVLETENGEAVQQYGRTIYLYLTEKAAERSVACLRALGYTPDSFRFLDKSQAQYHDLTGEKFTAWCDHETYKDELKEKWSIALDSEFEMAPADSQKLRELDSLFGKHLQSGAAPAKRAPRPQMVAAGVTGEGLEESDIPF